MHDGRLMCECPDCGKSMDHAREYARHYVLTHERGAR